MNLYEINTRIKSGEITFDPCGHTIGESRFARILEETIADANGASDGLWSLKTYETIEETNANMRSHFHSILSHNYEENDVVNIVRCEDEQCFGCGENLRWVLNGDKLTLRHYFNPNKVSDKKRIFSSIGDWESFPLDYKCPYENPKPFIGEIQVNSRLIFVNTFSHVKSYPDGVFSRSPEWCINYLRGRENVTKYKCNQNVASGHMGNMSIGIYLNENKDSIIIGPAYNPIELELELDESISDEEFEEAISKSFFEGYEMAGKISLEVWKWEASDFNTIGETNYIQAKEDNKYCGMVELDVKHGIWGFEHYFHTIKEDYENYCYSKFSLKEPA